MDIQWAEFAERAGVGGRESSGITARLLAEQLVNSGVPDKGKSLGEDIVLQRGLRIKNSVR